MRVMEAQEPRYREEQGDSKRGRRLHRVPQQRGYARIGEDVAVDDDDGYGSDELGDVKADERPPGLLITSGGGVSD